MRMELRLVLFLVLWDGRAALIRAEEVREAAEGGNFTVACLFSISGTKKVFCKNDCNKEDILVETSGNSGRNGRYSIKYEGKDLLSYDIMYVTITNVTSSDSGRYRCVLYRWSFDSKHEFRINITKDATSLYPIYTLKHNDIPSSFTVKTTAHIPSLTSVCTTEQSVGQAPVSSEQSTPPAPSAAPSVNLLFVSLKVVGILILLSAALMIFCWKKRTNNQTEPPVNTEYPEIPMYENSGPAPASTHDDSTYQSLSAASRDHNDTYSTIRTQPQLSPGSVTC